MSETIDGGAGRRTSWTVLDRSGWETGDELLRRLADALAGFGPGKSTVLYDHVSVDAVIDALDPESPSRAVSEIRFDYGRYEIMITRDGVIAAHPDPAASPRSS
ncbi:hypothetical protein [Halobellus ruber]|uniref:Halobacterial output domain-containing protein n=1 Tax=Halobellus ruber TaxID=2761102 RepID=A0A7J9SLM9_9EURY|nr:hypothetical protein [Halobellus ruber]MBB6647273.1 hypothetical protein [Halobellus ruber]